MILKALYDYYQRSNNLPKKGMELKEIAFLLVLDYSGNFIRFEDRRIDSKHAQEFLVTKSVGRTSAPKANYLYDNGAYVFGYSDKVNVGDSLKCFETFRTKIEEIYGNNPDNSDIEAVYRFYQNDIKTIHNALQKDPLWDDVVRNLNKKFSNFSFILEGDTKLIAEKQELLQKPKETDCMSGKVCLISGKKSEIVETTTATMIPGSQSTAKLVSFQVNSGYDSYGKTKGNNAPISEDAEFAYTTALNHMLRTDSHNKFVVGNRTFVFWTSKGDEIGRLVEESIWELFGFRDSNEDDPNQGVYQARKVFKSIYSGVLRTSLDNKFYILGLAPNSARIAVTYWAEIPLVEFASRINRHFEDMEIDGSKERKPYAGLYSMLSAVTLNSKISDVTPNLPESVVKSIFQGLPYPQPLFSGCIRRIRAEVADKDKRSVSIVRAAIIKAYLNRLNNKEQDIKVMLDKENTNQGYLCGRLFAVLDKIQSEANGQHSIKERYMNAASATPATVFATILNLSSHHSEKLKEGRNVFFEKVKQEIIDKIDANGFPAHLELQDQGRFFVGYYHQMQTFYIKNENEN